MFLKSRAKEMITKGRMVLSFMGRMSPNPFADEACYHLELLARALMSLASDVCTLHPLTHNTTKLRMYMHTLMFGFYFR